LKDCLVYSWTDQNIMIRIASASTLHPMQNQD
jgi:hypothetical protein